MRVVKILVFALSMSLGQGFSAKPSGSSKKAVPKKDSYAFIENYFNSECVDVNIPPSLALLVNSIGHLTSSGSDIRGRFVDHVRLGPIAKAASAIKGVTDSVPPLTPFAAYCLGYGYGKSIIEQGSSTEEKRIVALGTDPRSHAKRLADAFARGVLDSDKSMRVVFAGLASTPAMFEFCRAGLCDGGVMVTASHLPCDRNGFKLFSKNGGYTREQIQKIGVIAQQHAQRHHDLTAGFLPPTSGVDAVFCSEFVDFMPHYTTKLKQAIISKVSEGENQSVSDRPLTGLKIVLNPGNGCGGFFQNVLEDLGADVSASINVERNGDFPSGIPNPENLKMLDETIQACEKAGADLGVMLDTDADRSGFVVPTKNEQGQTIYQPLTRNRLIALLSVVFSRSSPGCTVVTDSVTSEGLTKFLVQNLGLEHVRYLKGYANVIGKAKELTLEGTANAELAIETSGHCAMKENAYLDDGTYCAVKVISLLAREKSKDEQFSLLDLISDLEEMPLVTELRMELLDGSFQTMSTAFADIVDRVEELSKSNNGEDPKEWKLDEENLEGVRVQIGDGGFFMLRKSLHDPLISLQIEAPSEEVARGRVINQLLSIFKSSDAINNRLDVSVLENF